MTVHDREGGRTPTEAELADLSRQELATLGMALDDVEVAHRDDPFPVQGTRAERRAEHQVAAWFGMATVTGLAFIGVFLFWPWEYAPASEDAEHLLYSLYTPLVGLTLGLAILGLGMGMIAYAKRLLPHETAVQQRHGGRSGEVDRQTMIAQLEQEAVNSGIGRRTMIKRTAGAAGGVFGLGLGVLTLGGLVRNPWTGGDHAPLLTTEWASEHGEKVYLRRYTGESTEVSLVRPEDLVPGALETVFPFRESERHDEHALKEVLKSADSPALLVRLRPDQAQKVVPREGQEDFNFGDYYAYSKICTHVGCPASLYEAQTAILLCPCHQSQFDLLTYAKPIFGPAARPLPQLPIDVDDEGYFVARHDFIEPVGPTFWERRA